MARTFLRHIRVNSLDELRSRILQGIDEMNAVPVMGRNVGVRCARPRRKGGGRMQCAPTTSSAQHGSEGNRSIGTAFVSSKAKHVATRQSIRWFGHPKRRSNPRPFARQNRKLFLSLFPFVGQNG
jgi:hypothetical protein